MGAMAQYNPDPYNSAPYNPSPYNPAPYNSAPYNPAPYNPAPYAPAYAPPPAVVISSYPAYEPSYTAPYVPSPSYPSPKYTSYSPAVVSYPSSSAETSRIESAKAVIKNPYAIAAVPSYVAHSYPAPSPSYPVGPY